MQTGKNNNWAGIISHLCIISLGITTLVLVVLVYVHTPTSTSRIALLQSELAQAHVPSRPTTMTIEKLVHENDLYRGLMHDHIAQTVHYLVATNQCDKTSGQTAVAALLVNLQAWSASLAQQYSTVSSLVPEFTNLFRGHIDGAQQLIDSSLPCCKFSVPGQCHNASLVQTTTQDLLANGKQLTGVLGKIIQANPSHQRRIEQAWTQHLLCTVDYIHQVDTMMFWSSVETCMEHGSELTDLF
jgi:hypothetical protein